MAPEAEADFRSLQIRMDGISVAGYHFTYHSRSGKEKPRLVVEGNRGQ